jgi:hypothetical protein
MEWISRIENRHSGYSWFVRIKHDGRVVGKRFSDSKYGGKELALKAAQEYLQQQPPEAVALIPPFMRRTKKNSTGIHGVSRTFVRTRTGGKLECYSVTWGLDGVRHTKKFYLHHYTDDESALRDAAEFRREREADMLREWQQKLRTRGQPPSPSGE